MSEEEAGIAAQQPPVAAEARPSNGVFVLTVPCAFFAATLLAVAITAVLRHQIKDVLSLFLTGGVFSAIVLCTTVWRVRSFVRADSTGLTWRGMFGRQRTVSWDEVTDYGYFSSVQTHNVIACELLPRRIVTQRGNVGFDRDWFGEEALRRAVSHYVTAAQTKEWKEIGTRPQDLPQRFAYSHALAWARIVFWSLVGPMVMGVVVVGAAGSARLLLPWGGWDWAVAEFLLPVLFMSGLMVVLLGNTYHRWRAVRSGTVITASESGLRFGQKVNERFVRWDEIGDYYVRHRGLAGTGFVLTLRGADEMEFEFTSLLHGYKCLARIILHFCPDPAIRETERVRWRYEAPDDVIGGAIARWNQDVVGTRVRVYRYRTRSNRFWLLVCTVVLVVTPGINWLAVNSGLDLPSSPSEVGGALALGIGVMSYIYLLFRFCRIEIDDFGLTYRSLWGTRRILWIAVVDYKVRIQPFAWYAVESRDGRRISFYGLIADLDELKQEIAARAPAPRTGWEELQTEAINAEPQRTVPK